MARPPHQPDEKTRAVVRALASIGVPYPKIAKYIGMSHVTLGKHYEEELACAKIDKTRAVANALFDNCMKGNVTAQIFWLKTQAGWKEPERSQIEDTDDQEDNQIERIEISLLERPGSGGPETGSTQ